jgi:ribosomal protein L10
MINKINTIKNKSKIKKYYDNMVNTSKYIIVESPNLNSIDTLQFRKKIIKEEFTIKMILKRLLHKLYIGSRKRNEKTMFKNNVYMVTAKNNNSNYKLLCKIMKFYKMKIVGIVNDNKLISDCQIYIECQFDIKILHSFLVKLLLLPILVLDSIKNKLLCK